MSVVAPFDTVDILQLHACVWITVVTTPTIEMISTNPVTVKIDPVVVAGRAFDPPDTTISADQLTLALAETIDHPAVASADNSVSVGAVV